MAERARAYDPSRGDIGVCQRCGNAVQHGQPYMAPIPFVGTWGGIVHRYCPPTLVIVTKQHTRPARWS